MFKLKNNFLPKGDQPKAIEELVKNFKENNVKEQILLGATGTGKTYTIANVIKELNVPTLFIVHNKTLALQLYSELKSYFPENKVEYFVSLFDFYTPEAYVIKSDTYVDKVSKSNLEISMMRRRAQNSLLSRKDTIVVTSVASIYGLDNPDIYKRNFFTIKKNQEIERKNILSNIVKIGYKRNEISELPGTFSVRGDIIKLIPGWDNDYSIIIDMLDNSIENISKIDAITSKHLKYYDSFTIFPAANYILEKEFIDNLINKIKIELEERKNFFLKNNKLVELQRITTRTEQDIETLKEFGNCSGIENYSAIIENRKKDEPPFTLFDYLGKDFLVIVDESHITLPQIRGMYNADRKRKENLVDYGFRLPSALDNRPIKFEEFIKKIDKTIYVSATPGEYELDRLNEKVVQQIIRPTGLLDPTIEIRKTLNQIPDLIEEIKKRSKNKERVFVTTLTIAMSEDLTAYLHDKKIKVAYLHNKLKTLERTKILNDLRRGVYDVIVGVNLLREGLDIPEVSLIAILDADKEGFLRDKRSLIQIIGRAARNVNGHIIMYADKKTVSMKEAIYETNRRRKIQNEYNLKNHILPTTIIKKIDNSKQLDNILTKIQLLDNSSSKKNKLKSIEVLINQIRKKMLEESANLNFEKAAEYRDIILELEINIKR